MGQPFSSYMKPLERAAAVAVISAVAGGALYLPEHFLKQGNLNNLVHLLSFSTWVGTQFWVTFIAGFVMIKVLPRHMFGLAQSRLFPAYFLAGTALSSITLSTYLVQNPFLRWKGHTLTTGILLTTSCLSNVVNFLYLEPKTTALMFENHRYDREKGKGEDGNTSVGTLSNTELQDDEVYVKMRNRFFMWHGISATANLLSYAASAFHLWNLAKTLQM